MLSTLKLRFQRTLTEPYILPEYLEHVRGKKLFYPASSSDVVEPVALFHKHVSEFWFCDIAYVHPKTAVRTGEYSIWSDYAKHGLEIDPAITLRDAPRFPKCAEREIPALNIAKDRLNGCRLVESALTEEPNPRQTAYRAPRSCEFESLTRTWLREVYENPDGSRFTVIRRGGFAQHVLMEEFSPGSIGVFMHRRDACGAGGSDLAFLDDNREEIDPLTGHNLFSLLLPLLSDPALIITDGSMSSFRLEPRLRFHKDEMDEEALRRREHWDCLEAGLEWKCVGWMSVEAPYERDPNAEEALRRLGIVGPNPPATPPRRAFVWAVRPMGGGPRNRPGVDPWRSPKGSPKGSHPKIWSPKGSHPKI